MHSYATHGRDGPKMFGSLDLPQFWVDLSSDGDSLYSIEICLKFWGLPRKRVWYVRGLLWKLIGNCSSRNYCKSHLPRPWGDMTYSRRIHKWVMTYSWYTHMCELTNRWRIHKWSMSYSWRIRMWDLTYSYVKPNLFVTYSYVRAD